MKKRLFVMMLLSSTFASAPGFSADFKVQSVKEHPRQAIIIDKDSGSEWLVKEGDRVDRSIVREIRRSHVTIVTPIDKDEAVAFIIPAVEE